MNTGNAKAAKSVLPLIPSVKANHIIKITTMKMEK
jgi:hypothetical protein